MLNLYNGSPLDHPKDMEYINRLLQQLEYTHYNLHKKVTHYDYQIDECNVSENWTIIAPRNLIKNTVRHDILTTNPWDVEIELLTDNEIQYLIELDSHDKHNTRKATMHVLSIKISLNPEDEIEYTLTPVSKRQLNEMLKNLYQPDEMDTEKYEEVIR